MPKKQKYRISNWSEYNKALVNRGSLTIWFDAERDCCKLASLSFLRKQESSFFNELDFKKVGAVPS